MNDLDKGKNELVNELMEMRQKNAELEASLVALRQRGEAGQEAETACKAMIEAFDGLIYVCSSNYEVEFMNERFIQRTGYNPIGEKCYRAIHDRDLLNHFHHQIGDPVGMEHGHEVFYGSGHGHPFFE